MKDRNRAIFRLTVLVAAALALVFLSCRPAWSPDGKRLLFHMSTGPEKVGVAIYERDTGTVRRLAGIPADQKVAALAWSADSRTALALATDDQKNVLHVIAITVDEDVGIAGQEGAQAAVRTFDVPVAGDRFLTFTIPPVVVGERLFLATGGITRLDLTSGEIATVAPPAGHLLAISRRGDGLCYLSLPEKNAQPDWEFGTLDPETLVRTPLVTAPKDCEWLPIPTPSFTPSLDRIVMPARRAAESEGKAQALLVIRNGEIETSLPLGADRLVGFNSVEWAQDGVTLLATVCRHDEEHGTWQFALLETTFSGSVARETEILTIPVGKDQDAPSFAFQMALSPDGEVAAFSTAMFDRVPPEQAGLYLVDLTDKARKVRRVPFPEK
ncbi:MAG: PD40 domain-containing protein [Planctomycetes bacterium]|nr:PD40 domain-containing protein [Planctomycetota bacterium]